MKKIIFSIIFLAYFVLNSQTYAVGSINNIYYGVTMSYESKIKADKIVDSLVTIIEKNGGRKGKKYSFITNTLEKYQSEKSFKSSEGDTVITYIRAKLENHFYDKSLLKGNLLFENKDLMEGKNEINLDFNNPIIKAKCDTDLKSLNFDIETNSGVIYTNSTYSDLKNRCNIDLTYMLDENDLTEFKLNINGYNTKLDNSQDNIYQKSFTVKLINKKNENKIGLTQQSKQEEKFIEGIQSNLEYNGKTYLDILNINSTGSNEKNYFENIKNLEIKCSEDLYSLVLSSVGNPNNITYSNCENGKSIIQIPENDGSEKIDYVLRAYYYDQSNTVIESNSMVPSSEVSTNNIEKYFSIEPKNKKTSSEFKKELKIIDNGTKKELFFGDELVLSVGKNEFISIEIINQILKVVEINGDTYLFFSNGDYKVLKQETTKGFYFNNEKSNYSYIITQKGDEFFLYSEKDGNLIKEFTGKDIIKGKDISINYLIDFSDNYVTIVGNELNEIFGDFYKTINLKR